MPRKPAAATEIVKLKVTLAGLRPSIWRRLLVPTEMTLGDLHRTIQPAMGWHDSHLHDFDTGSVRYGTPGMLEDTHDEDAVTLADILAAGVRRFLYTYDFGDGWEHQIDVEGTVPPAEAQRYPACVGGKHACPPEDCGGPYGFANLLAVRADPSHPDHEEMSEWLGVDYDPEAFSVAEADARLAARFRPKRRRR